MSDTLNSASPGEPVPVAIITPDPIPVVLAHDPRTPGREQVQRQSIDPSIPARTTFQEDLTTAGQRRINLIWEWTQAIIAIAVVVFTMVSGVVAMVWGFEIPSIVSVAFGMVTGFYFSRTNHAAIGGVGPKAQPADYRGR
jgi:hypothetical protein